MGQGGANFPRCRTNLSSQTQMTLDGYVECWTGLHGSVTKACGSVLPELLGFKPVIFKAVLLVRITFLVSFTFSDSTPDLYFCYSSIRNYFRLSYSVGAPVVSRSCSPCLIGIMWD